MMSASLPRPAERLPAYSLYAAVLAAAGLPIYIYAPKFYADTYGVSLTSLAAMLFVLRLFDVVQDPALGWVSERLGPRRGRAMVLGAVLLAGSMLGLFAVTPMLPPLIWFGLMITGLFSGFSFLTINFYAQGITKAGEIAGGHTRLAAWRETGALLGVCIAAVAPSVLQDTVAAPFAVFALGFAALALVASVTMAPEWSGVISSEPTPIRTILSDKIARKLLILALVNAAPSAVSSTLFLFYVESRLGAPGWEGGLLVLFFLSAALSAPIWAALAARFGAKRVLLGAMVCAIIAFGFAVPLGDGDAKLFAIICIFSGATIGADLTLLPALFARRMAAISPNGSQAFGLWALVSKFTLAFAAVLLLPALQMAGFSSGALANPPEALFLLTILYALVPCALKLVAIAILLATPIEE